MFVVCHTELFCHSTDGAERPVKGQLGNQLVLKLNFSDFYSGVAAKTIIPSSQSPNLFRLTASRLNAVQSKVGHLESAKLDTNILKV